MNTSVEDIEWMTDRAIALIKKGIDYNEAVTQAAMERHLFIMNGKLEAAQRKYIDEHEDRLAGRPTLRTNILALKLTEAAVHKAVRKAIR